MRRSLFVLLAILPAAVLAQQDPALYPYRKPAPPATVIESGNSGIPTDGTAQMRQLKAEQRQKGGTGPTWVYREPGKGKPTFMTGPDGTRVCTDASGHVTVCW